MTNVTDFRHRIHLSRILDMVTMGFRGTHSQRSYWWRIGLTGVLGVIIALVSYLYGAALERDIQAREFQRLAQVQQQNAQELLRRSTRVLLAFRGFFAASQQVSREEYTRFAAEILANSPEIYAVHWAPKVTPQQRAAFEAELSSVQAVPLGIFDVDDASRGPHRAGSRAMYLPVQYSAPLAANLKVLGLDALHRASNQETIRDATASGEQRLTPAFSLLQDPSGPLTAALYQPVFQAGLPIATPEQRRAALEGFLILMLRPSLLLEGLPFGEHPVELRLYEHQGERMQAIYPRDAQMLDAAENVVHHPLQVPGRSWVMEFVTSEGFGNRIHLQPLLLMLSLLLLTIASLVFIDHSHRTALALREANDKLLDRQQVLDGLAHHDALTGLVNRLRLCHRIDQALAGQRRQGNAVAVCLLDLDGFKAVNDRYGHAAGDLVLCEVATRLQATVRSSDTVARLGGDEFVLLLPGMSGALGLQRLMQQLLERIGQPIALGENGPQVAVSASIGVAFADGRQDADTLLNQADIAMYQAKKAGKHAYRVFTEATADDCAPA